MVCCSNLSMHVDIRVHFLSFAYAGKPRSHDSQPCKYYVRDTEETVKTMVKNLLKSTNLSGRNLLYDRSTLL